MLINKDFPLSQILYYKLSNTAKYVLHAQSKEDLIDAIKFIKEKGFFDRNKYVIAGSGSNLIFRDEYYDGAVIHLAYQKDQSGGIVTDSRDKCMIHVPAGELVDNLINYALERNLSGLEWAGGLPGSVGGAVRGNAGAFGAEISDTLFSATVLNIAQEILEESVLENKDMDFGYRQSLIKSRGNMIVTHAVFKLKEADKSEISRSRQIYENNIAFRKKNHPMEYPSCGSVFKNISEQKRIEAILGKWPEIGEQVRGKWHGKVPVGYINKRLKLSGLRYGDMQISEKHSNFIVNLGEGKSSDVLKLIDEIKSRIFGEFGFVPDAEVEII